MEIEGHTLIEYIRRAELFVRVERDFDGSDRSVADSIHCALPVMVRGEGPMGAAWLPTTHDGEAPAFDAAILGEIRERGQGELARRLGLQAATEAMRVSRALTTVPAMKLGADDLLPAARGAFVYACRRAAAEIVLEREGVWARVLRWYGAGRWPGAYLLVPDGEPLLVVF